ncbi:MAG: sulfatase-like hydrolase/transferase, partial [Planctomycetales bacterium]|nr:sulfatase-like hydrolase/transferase [Planctomycetales bacterium]
MPSIPSASAFLVHAFGLLFLLTLNTASATADAPPNVLLILADDLGYGDVGFNGCKDIPTPHLDKLAAEGVRFSSGYSSHPFCSPMRAGLMACRYQHRFGYVANVAFDPHNTTMGLPTQQTTLASRLSETGYRTGMVGKWHLGAAAPFHPLNRGFDFFYGFLGGGHDYFVVDTKVQLNENYKAALDDNGTPTGFSGYLTDALTDKAIEFIRRSDDKPYFAYVAYNAPHGPLQATEEKLQQFRSIQNKKRRTYAGMVSSMDDQIGRLLAEVDARGERDNTLVIFLSDNGGPENANASDNGPLRGQKGDAYEGGIRVPFVMRWSGTIPTGMVYDHPIISLDASYTALSVAGADRPENLDGVNLIPYLTGDQTGAPHASLFWMKEGHTGWAVRTGNEKLVYEDQTTALYDLANDLGEQNDLLSKRPDVVTRLNDSFQSWDQLNSPNFIVPYRDYHIQLKA